VPNAVLSHGLESGWMSTEGGGYKRWGENEEKRGREGHALPRAWGRAIRHGRLAGPKVFRKWGRLRHGSREEAEKEDQTKSEARVIRDNLVQVPVTRKGKTTTPERRSCGGDATRPKNFLSGETRTKPGYEKK